MEGPARCRSFFVLRNYSRCPPVLPLGGIDIAACVRGRIVDVDRNGGRGTDGGAVGKVVIAGNDVALLVAQDSR